MSPSAILDKILTYTNLNIKSFSESLGLDRPQAIYDIQKGKTKTLSSTMINKITSVYSEINRNWLLTGEGEMLKNASNTSIIGNQNNIGHGNKIHNESNVSNELEIKMLKLEIESLKKQLEDKDRIIAAKDKTLELYEKMSQK